MSRSSVVCSSRAARNAAIAADIIVPVSLFRRPPRSQPAVPTPNDDARRPGPVTLYSDYVGRKPPGVRPMDSAGQAMRPYMFTDPLGKPIRHKLVLLLEQNQPRVQSPDPRFQHAANAMAHVAVEKVVAVRGDLSLRPSGYRPLDPFQHLAALVLQADAPLALDAVGAWVDAYARTPGLPWLRDEEAQFLTQLEEILSETIFAVRGREVILREDLGASVLIDKPLAGLVTSNPLLRGVDDKLREALDELAAGNAADAVTDAGTALQMLLDHLGYAGGQLGDQLKTARKAGWLSGVDTPMAASIESLVTWIASVRNQRSDAHHGPAPDKRDAELAVRIVGLLVLRFG